MLGVDRKVFDNDVNTEGSSMLFEDNSFYEMTQEPSLDDETTWLEGEECEDLFGITNMNSNESIYYECQLNYDRCVYLSEDEEDKYRFADLVGPLDYLVKRSTASSDYYYGLKACKLLAHVHAIMSKWDQYLAAMHQLISFLILSSKSMSAKESQSNLCKCIQVGQCGISCEQMLRILDRAETAYEKDLRAKETFLFLRVRYLMETSEFKLARKYLDQLKCFLVHSTAHNSTEKSHSLTQLIHMQLDIPDLDIETINVMYNELLMLKKIASLHANCLGRIEEVGATVCLIKHEKLQIAFNHIQQAVKYYQQSGNAQRLSVCLKKLLLFNTLQGYTTMHIDQSGLFPGVAQIIGNNRFRSYVSRPPLSEIIAKLKQLGGDWIEVSHLLSQYEKKVREKVNHHKQLLQLAQAQCFTDLHIITSS